MNYCTSEDYGNNFGGCKMPNVLQYAKKKNQFVQGISRYRLEDDEDNTNYEIVTVNEHFDKNILGLHYLS